MRDPRSHLGSSDDFSLVQGGPLFQLFLRLRLQAQPTGLTTRRIVAAVLIAWAPLLVLSLWAGDALSGVAVPFALDVGAQVRLLLCMPLLLAADVVVHRRLQPVIRQFLERRIVAPEHRAQLEREVGSAMRLRDSMTAELLLLAVAIFAGHWVGQRFVPMELPSWIARPGAEGSSLTTAGFWYLFISLNIYRFLLLRWCFRLFVWYRFLWRISRHVPLRLNALHPDRAAGLGFLPGSVFAFAPVLVAQTTLLAGVLGGRILLEGASLAEFKLEIAAWLVALTLVAIAPLFFFMTHLAEARRTGIREYGALASRYADEFRRTWIDGAAAEREPLLGSADIQSLADLSNSFDVVRELSLVPFGRTLVFRLVLLMSVPILPLTLTMIPLEELVDRAFGLFF